MAKYRWGLLSPRPGPGMVSWLLSCLLLMLLGYYYAVQPAPLLAQTQEPPLVTQKIRYHMPAAGEVFLVWGIDGWNVVPEDIRPVGTEVKNKVMHTPMDREGDTFIAKVQATVGATLDYGFLITKERNGAGIEAVWDGGYQTSATQDDIVEVETTVTLPQDQTPASHADAPLVTQEILYHMPEAGEVFLVWGIDGWQVVPEEIRPDGTFVDDAIMYTPMVREHDAFIVQIQVPAGVTIDYVFQTTKTLNGTAVEVWDTNDTPKRDYHTVATQAGIIEVQATSRVARLIKKANSGLSLTWFILILVGAFLSLGTVVLKISLSPRISKGVKKGVLIFATNVVPIIIAVFVGEFYLRSLDYLPYVRTFPGYYQNDPKTIEWAQSDPVLGWVSNKNDPDINPQGFRDKKDFNTMDLDSDKIRVMILGDSFMWGAGVEVEQNLPNLLQTRLEDSYQIFNLGVPGWGIDQMYLAYQQYKDIINPDIVILAFIDRDANRVLEAYRIWEGLNKPSFTIRNGELVSRISASKSQRFLNNIMGKSTFFSLIMQEIYLITDARPIVNHILLDLAQETEQHQAKFAVVRIPTQDHFDAISQINRRLYDFEGMLKGTNALYLEPSEEITQIPNWDVDFYFDDGHMSVAGNQYLADYIYKHIFQDIKPPNRILDRSAMQGHRPLLVTQEIRYHMPEAGEVFLVWGIDGWKVVPEKIRPAGTEIPEKVMRTPMVREGDTFVVKVQVTSETTINYGFLITKKDDGTEIRAVWDGGKQDYRIIATEDDVIEVKSSLTLAQAMELPTILDVGLYLLAGLGVVFVFGIVVMRIPGQHNSRVVILVLIVLMLVGLALRLGVVSTTDRLLNTPAQLIGDESRYDNIAYALRQGEFFPWPSATPIYPLFLAGVYLIFGHSYAGALYLQAFVGTTTIPLTYRLARRFTGRRSSLLAAMLVALHPNLIGQTAVLYTEVLYTPLLLLALLGLLWALEAPVLRRFILAGVLLGIANLVRPATALIPLFLPLILPRVWSFRRRAALWVVYSAAMAAVIIPWTYHNYRTHNTFLPFSLAMVQVWHASPEFYHLMKQKPNAIVRAWDEELNPERNGGHDPLTIEGDRYFTARGIASIRAEPGIYAWYSLQKLAFFWIGHPAADYDWPFNFALLRTKHSAGWIAAMFGFRLLLVVTTLVGLIILWRRLRVFTPLLFICGYLMLVQALLVPVARYSEPLYPILAVIIAAAVSELIDRYRAHLMKTLQQVTSRYHWAEIEQWSLSGRTTK